METRLIKIMEITLPWPPSLNHYYRHVGPKVLISKEGWQYRRKVAKQLGNDENLTMYECPIELSMELYPPDNRKRDVDNSLKSCLDALMYGKLYADDSLIRKLVVEKKPSSPPQGTVVVSVKACDNVCDYKARETAKLESATAYGLCDSGIVVDRVDRRTI
ncbi:MAG: RusA family crossover junction endodeoxyribonuclease [Puniceicoccales bacterium]|jgi:Holliday junction resolvase RusA-like endonuclease|nr:RusA family crossover junction endodeoxyribonuclease [Puniceicoccales bacterium]